MDCSSLVSAIRFSLPEFDGLSVAIGSGSDSSFSIVSLRNKDDLSPESMPSVTMNDKDSSPGKMGDLMPVTAPLFSPSLSLGKKVGDSLSVSREATCVSGPTTEFDPVLPKARFKFLFY